MRQNSFYGSALIVSSVFLVVTGMTHPGVAGMFSSRESLEHLALVDRIAHGFAIAGMWLSIVGLAGFSRMLSSSRPIVTAAFAAFAITAAGVVIAATLDGFVVPNLASRWYDADDATRAALRQLIRFCFLVASALTRIYMASASVAILLWSFVAWRVHLSRGLPWMGVLVSIAAAAAISRGSLEVGLHEVLALALVQAIWMGWAGVVMLRFPEVASNP